MWKYRRRSWRFLWTSLLGTIIASSMALATTVAWAGDKVALVVGNGAYSEITKLDNPPRDANLIASKLRLLDFDVLEIIDADRIEMEQALREFGRRATDADAAVFFYAGHGIQDSGRNYLLPVSAELEHRGDLRYETLELSKVMEELELAAARVSVVILDACRDNPLKDTIDETSATRSLEPSQGLATVRGATGTLIAYATAPGKVAYDGVGNNSPFSAALAEWIDEPGLEIGLMFRRVRQEVVEATNKSQVPWVEEAILGDFYFAGDNREEAPKIADSTRPFDIADPDAVFWRTITEMETTDEKRAGLNLYLDVFPTGQFAGEAQAQLTLMDSGQTLLGPSFVFDDVSAPGAGAFTDLLFWERVRESTNPDDLEAYLKSYPDGLFAGLAAERLEALLSGTQIASLSNDLYTRSFTIPFGSQAHPLTFQQAEINRAMARAPVARIERVPEVGDVLVGPQTALIGDEISQDSLSQIIYVPEPGITGPLGQFSLAVSEPGRDEVVLMADVNIRYPDQPVRDIAATSGVGPVPMTIPLPAMSGDEERDLVIDALPYGARVLTANSEVGISDRIPVKDGVAELAIDLPEGKSGNVGEIVYSYQPSSRGLREDAAAKNQSRQEAISIAGVVPDYSAQSAFDTYIGVGPQRLPITLPDDLSTKVLIEEVPFGKLQNTDGTTLIIGDYLPANKLTNLFFEPHNHLRGSVGQLVFSYETSNGDRLVQAAAINAAIHDCDLLAAMPFDPDRVSDGKWLLRTRGEGRPADTYLDSAAAILACLSASDAFPHVDRFKLQVGRSYTAAKSYENALKWIIPLAKRGNMLAVSGVAYHYSQGWGVPIDYKKSFEMNAMAAKAGVVPAAHEIGKAYRDGLGVERNYEEAAKWIKIAADWGFDWAQLNMGKLYLNGLGVPRDDAMAFQWFQKAYEQRNAFANYELGMMYLAGRAVPRNPARAEELFSEIPYANEVEWALYELARVYRYGEGLDRDVAKAINLLEQAIALDVSAAKVELAEILLNEDSVTPDPERAVSLLKSASAEGATYASVVLGHAYETGQGLPQDQAKAVTLYQEAAAVGDSGAQIRLGDVYRTGNGLPKDASAARRLFEQASQSGSGWAALRLADMDLKGEAGPIDLDKAIANYGRALRGASQDQLVTAAKSGLEALPQPVLVRTIQRWLQERGYDPGPADGVIGGRTRNAIEAFERSKGLPLTGDVSLELVAALAPDSAG